jgi:hypothetical protein
MNTKHLTIDIVHRLIFNRGLLVRSTNATFETSELERLVKTLEEIEDKKQALMKELSALKTNLQLSHGQ